MRKVLTALLVLVFVLQMLPAAFAEPAAEATLTSVSAQRGETVTVTVAVNNCADAKSVYIVPQYDETVLEIVSGTWLVSGMLADDWSAAFGDAAIVFSANTDINKDIFRLEFKVKEDAAIGQTSNVGCELVVKTMDGQEEIQVDVAVVEGTVCVVCAHSDVEDVEASPATCAQSGFTAGVYCNDCQTYISGHEEIERTGEHSDADGKWNYDEDGHYCVCACGLMYAGAPHSGGSAACTTKAVCDICHIEYGSVDASAHGQTEVRDASEATCNQEGYTGDTYCQDCGEMISAGSVISATGNHTGGEATCKEQAVCEVCGTAYGELDTDNHKNLAHFWPVYEATCTEPGYSGDAYCECGEIMWTGEVYPAAGHKDYDEDGVCDECDADMSCEHSGGEATCTQQAVCEICGAAYGELDANNHGETKIKGAVEATCGNAGFSGDTCCADCGEVIEAGSMIAATGEHTDEDADELCDVCGAEVPKDEEPKEENPGTGDANLVWLVMIMACSALAVVCVGKKKYTV